MTASEQPCMLRCSVMTILFQKSLIEGVILDFCNGDMGHVRMTGIKQIVFLFRDKRRGHALDLGSNNGTF